MPRTGDAGSAAGLIRWTSTDFRRRALAYLAMSQWVLLKIDNLLVTNQVSQSRRQGFGELFVRYIKIEDQIRYGLNGI